MKKILKKSILCFAMLISLSLIGVVVAEIAGGGFLCPEKI